MSDLFNTRVGGSANLISHSLMSTSVPPVPLAQTPKAALGYVILYVENVAATLAFYETAFGLVRRFLHDEGGQAYGELETGATRQAFASFSLAKANLGDGVVLARPGAPLLGAEIALVVIDVETAYRAALAAGAMTVKPPEAKPWGQIVAYVRDPSGHAVELCTALP